MDEKALNLFLDSLPLDSQVRVLSKWDTMELGSKGKRFVLLKNDKIKEIILDWEHFKKLANQKGGTR